MRIKRTISAVLIVTLAIVAIAVAYLVPEPDRTATEPPMVTANAGVLTLTCAGGVERTITGLNPDNAEETYSGTASVLMGSVPAGTEWTAFDGVTTNVTASPVGEGLTGQTNLGTPELAGVLSILGAADARVITGATTFVGSDGDLRGTASNPCQWGNAVAWLVGGSTEVGSSTVLVIANPSLTTVEARIEAFGPAGPLDLGSNAVVNLPARSVREITLEGVMDPHDRIALRVGTTSGSLTAVLRTTALDGYTPRGVSFVNPSAVGSTLVIPGVTIPALTSGEKTVAGATEATLRIVNPTDAIRTADVKVITANGKVDLPGGNDIQIAPGAVLDLTLGGLGTGERAIVVEADGDVSAGVLLRETEMEGKRADIAWLSATPQVTSGSATVGKGDSVVAIEGTATVTWHAYDATGAEIGSEAVEVTNVGAVKLPAGTVFVSVDSSAPIRGAVRTRTWVAGGWGIDWAPLTVGVAESTSVKVKVGN